MDYKDFEKLVSDYFKRCNPLPCEAVWDGVDVEYQTALLEQVQDIPDLAQFVNEWNQAHEEKLYVSRMTNQLHFPANEAEFFILVYVDYTYFCKNSNSLDTDMLRITARNQANRLLEHFRTTPVVLLTYARMEEAIKPFSWLSLVWLTYGKTFRLENNLLGSVIDFGKP